MHVFSSYLYSEIPQTFCKCVGLCTLPSRAFFPIFYKRTMPYNKKNLLTSTVRVVRKISNLGLAVLFGYFVLFGCSVWIFSRTALTLGQ
jgi:hypothetical protein